MGEEDFRALLTLLDDEMLSTYTVMCFMEQASRSNNSTENTSTVTKSEVGDPRDPKLWIAPTVSGYVNYMRNHGMDKYNDLTVSVDYTKLLENLEAHRNGLR